jgi:hypothetical protein
MHAENALSAAVDTGDLGAEGLTPADGGSLAVGCG